MTSEAESSTLSYEAALGELDEIIAKLEGGAVALDGAIAFYERGAHLARHCAALLDSTEQKVSQLVIGGGGAIVERPLADDVALPIARGRAERLRVDPDEIPF